MPKRIQRRRTKGWRMPEGAVYVGRPSRWGNPFKVIQFTEETEERSIPTWSVVDEEGHALWSNPYLPDEAGCGRCDAHWAATDLYRQAVADPNFEKDDFFQALAGKDLACWCPLDLDCHADVLLELANPEVPS